MYVHFTSLNVYDENMSLAVYSLYLISPVWAPVGCRTGLICFLARWRKRRSEPGCGVLRFSFA